MNLSCTYAENSIINLGVDYMRKTGLFLAHLGAPNTSRSENITNDQKIHPI